MIALGIESTAHTFGVGIVDEKAKVLANEKSALKTETGGIHPQKAADHHLEKGLEVLRNALEKASLDLKDIDVIAFAQGPGLGPCLRIGAVGARTIALIHNKPLVGVNHCIAHIEIGRKKTNAKDPVALYVSGGNTQVISYRNNRYRIFGETLDIGIGNLLDSFGRRLGIGFPAGPVLDRWYFEGHKFAKLPYSVKGMDLVFSGLETAAAKKIGTIGKKDLAYSLLHTAFSMLAEVTERALAQTGKKEVLIVGGVAASKALQQIVSKMCEERGAKMFVPNVQLCVDNGAMIAWQGLLEFMHGKRTPVQNSAVKQRFRTDEVEVNWL